MSGPNLGSLLREARLERGLSQAAVARDLNLPEHLLDAIEHEAWTKIPTGRERPLVRLVARHLELDLAAFPDAWASLPGTEEPEELDPRRDRLERWMMGTLTVGCAIFLLWLFMPGRNLKRGFVSPEAMAHDVVPQAWNAPPSPHPYPVLGEVLPEAPVNEEGVLVAMRAVDTCQARIEGVGLNLERTLRVSDPWRLRVKGAFTIVLLNASVVSLEVANRPIQHGGGGTAPWSGHFGADGTWIKEQPLPASGSPDPAAPDPRDSEQP